MDQRCGGSGRPRVYITTNPDTEEIGDGGFDFSLPLGSIDFGDIASEIDKIDLFDIKPRASQSDGVRLAGNPPERLPEIVVRPGDGGASGEPGIGHNGGPPLDPPNIPKQLPSTTESRMGFVRRAAGWIARIGRRAPAVNIFFGALDQANDLKRLTDMIKTANDPAETLDVLRDRVTRQSEDGYNDHHIVNQHAGNRKNLATSELTAGRIGFAFRR